MKKMDLKDLNINYKNLDWVYTIKWHYYCSSLLSRLMRSLNNLKSEVISAIKKKK